MTTHSGFHVETFTGNFNKGRNFENPSKPKSLFDLPEIEIPDTGQGLVNRVFFICDSCCGALVPLKICEVCNKAYIRQCVECGLQVRTSHHRTCEDLLLVKKKKIMC